MNEIEDQVHDPLVCTHYFITMLKHFALLYLTLLVMSNRKSKE
jgi:hypothetical protein